MIRLRTSDKQQIRTCSADYAKNTRKKSATWLWRVFINCLNHFFWFLLKKISRQDFKSEAGSCFVFIQKNSSL